MQVELSVKTRNKVGSPDARRQRREGKMPAVVYGLGMDPVSVLVDASDFEKTLKTEAGSNVIIKPTKKKYILKEILTPEKKSEEKSNSESHQPKEAAKEVESKSDEVVKEKKVNTQQTETQE